MKNIFASISWLDEIISMGLPQDKYLAVRLRAFYQYGTNRGMDSDAALVYAKERLKYNIDKAGNDRPKAGKEKPIVEEKSIYKKDPSSIRPKVKKTKESLSEDEILDSRISTVKPEVRELVDNKLREIVGDVSDEEFVKVQNLFKREKTQSGLTNRETLEEVSRVTGKQRDFAKKKERSIESVPSNVSERDEHQSDFDTSQDHNLYDFIKSLDPSNAERNLVLFKKYRMQGYRVSTALDRIRKVGELREFCNVNNIPIELATRFINVYPNLEDAKRELLEWKRKGGFGLETNVLPVSKSGTGIEANPVVDYEGRKVKLKRLIQSLYSDKLSSRELRMMYSTVYHNVFDFGKSIGEAIEYANKTIRMYRARDIFESEFPEDPKYAESVFEGHYLTEGNTFEEAMRMTREEIGKKVISSSLVRVAMMLEEDCYWDLSDKFMSYLSKRL
jgi:hypothetical protein